jgi:hypothetical protein
MMKKMYARTKWLQWAAVGLSLWLLADVSHDVWTAANPVASHGPYLWICGLLMADFVGLWLVAADRRTFLRRHWPLLIVSLPLSWIAEGLWADAHPGVYHALRFLPLVRGLFSLYVIVSWWVNNLRGMMLLTYGFVSIAVVYYASLLFYCYERGVNPAVGDYADALWWAAMNFTTIGSNIVAVSLTGKVLGVVMGFCGMMMLPVFTAFYVGVTQTRRP